MYLVLLFHSGSKAFGFRSLDGVVFTPIAKSAEHGGQSNVNGNKSESVVSETAPVSCKADHFCLFEDHDAIGLIWDDRTGRWLDTQSTFQHWPKRFPDNVCPKLNSCVRRVMGSRTAAAEADTWTVGAGVQTQSTHPILPARLPDSEDPPELEYYRARPFVYHDRLAAAVLNYAPSPQAVNPRQMANCTSKST